MTPRFHVSWSMVERRCFEVADEARSVWSLAGVYGVPRGGCVPAALIATGLGLPLVERPAPNVLVVDDLVDSGATMARYDGGPFVALYRKSWSPLCAFAAPVPDDAWVVFPWEADEVPAVDAVLRLLQLAGHDTTLPAIRAAVPGMVDGVVRRTSADLIARTVEVR